MGNNCMRSAALAVLKVPPRQRLRVRRLVRLERGNLLGAERDAIDPRVVDGADEPTVVAAGVAVPQAHEHQAVAVEPFRARRSVIRVRLPLR